MRLVVLGGLLVAALACVMLFVIHREIAVEPLHSRVESASATPASPTVVSPAHTSEPRREWSAPHRSSASPAPAISGGQETVAVAAKHVDTPVDQLRWSLMRAIRTTEPAVLDCIDKAKQAGIAVDGTSIYGFYVGRKADQLVVDSSTFDSGPYPASLNNCIQAVTTNAVVDSMPDDAKRVQAFRKLVVEHGEITAYKLQSFHVDPPATAP